jgi:tRNA pseudouridine55 synthase
MYSALKRDGRPLYEYARKGQSVERKARPVTIHALDLVTFTPPDRACLRLVCSKGTYVRTLAADLGARLGVGAHLVGLRRTASGPFRLEQAITLDELARRLQEGQAPPFLSVLEALAHLPRVEVDESQAVVLRHGKQMEWVAFTGGRELAGPVCAVLAGRLVAMVERAADGNLKILRGFRAD